MRQQYRDRGVRHITRSRHFGAYARAPFEMEYGTGAQSYTISSIPVVSAFLVTPLGRKSSYRLV